MNISFAEKKENYACIELAVNAEDYKERVDNRLKKLKTSVQMPGFRKGHVPSGVIQKAYGERVKVEEIESLVSDRLFSFIQEEKLKTIGQPIVSEESEKVNFATDDKFTMKFDVALIPDDMPLPDSQTKLPYYEIEISDEMVQEAIDNSLEGAAQPTEVDVVEADDFVRGSIYELDGNQPKEGGVRKEENAILLVKYIKNEEERNKFIGSSKNSVITFDPFKAFDGSQAEISSLLGISREETTALEGHLFSFEINSITRRVKPEFNQEFFDQVFGEGVVKDVEEAKAKVHESMVANFASESDSLFLQSLRNLVREELAPKVVLDDRTIRRWYVTTPEAQKQGNEGFDEHFSGLLISLKSDLILRTLAAKNKVEVSDKEVEDFAISMIRARFQSAGFASLPEDVLRNVAKENLDKDGNRDNYIYAIRDLKVAKEVKKEVQLDTKKVSVEEFRKISEELYKNNEEENTEE